MLEKKLLKQYLSVGTDTRFFAERLSCCRFS